MAQPNGGLITESNSQYYAGSQMFIATADQTVGEIKTLLAGSPLGPTHLSESYYTETELNAGQLDNRYYTETESDARYFNVSTGDTIKEGVECY